MVGMESDYYALTGCNSLRGKFVDLFHFIKIRVLTTVSSKFCVIFPLVNNYNSVSSSHILFQTTSFSFVLPRKYRIFFLLNLFLFTFIKKKPLKTGSKSHCHICFVNITQ